MPLAVIFMTHSDIIETFLEHIRAALAPNKIEPPYYGLNYWEHTNHFVTYLESIKRLFLKKYLERYHERVFCYEFYHKLRVLMDEELDENQSQIYLTRNILLQSELIKKQVDQFVEMVYKITRLSKEFMPDFLLHTPGDFSNQLVVMEVKSTPTLTIGDLSSDILKIQEFINNYHYEKGIFVGINVSDELRKRLFLKLNKLVPDNFNTPENILIFIKDKPHSQLQEYSLNNLIQGYSYRPFIASQVDGNRFVQFS